MSEKAYFVITSAEIVTQCADHELDTMILVRDAEALRLSCVPVWPRALISIRLVTRNGIFTSRLLRLNRTTTLINRKRRYHSTAHGLQGEVATKISSFADEDSPLHKASTEI